MQRDELIDALRGFALFGILAVNIQCFVTGLNAPSLGILDAQSTLADHVVIILTAFLLEFKFYPLFSFCFGYGFAVQTRRWTLLGEPVGPRFIRRMNAMLFMGILHGGLLWFGDILARYAITGYVLRRYAGCGPRRLLVAAKFWLIAALILMVVFVGLSADSSPGVAADIVGKTSGLQADAARALNAYSQGSYVEATIQRINDYTVVMFGFIMLLPHIMVIFLLGALAAQLGLLRRPDRHRHFWEAMMRLGLWVGIPVNMVYAWHQWHASLNPWTTSHSVTATLSGELAPILSMAFIAAFALYGGSGLGRKIVLFLAPAGRIALTLYIGQSIAMALLLNGFGAGLGATSGPSELFTMAIGIYVLSVGASHVMQRYAIPAPLEMLWRRYTYAPVNATRPHRNS